MSKLDQKHSSIQFDNQVIYSYEYKEYGILGVGKNRYPIISMDEYIDHTDDLSLHIECCKGLALCNDIKMGMIYGAIPIEERSKFDYKDSWSEMLMNIKQYDPDGVHEQAIKELIKNSDNPQQAIYKYAYFAMGSIIPWFFGCYLKHNSFFGKTKDNSDWNNNSKLFPNVVNYLKKLPFKEIGRVLFFTTYPRSGVVIHRDSIVAEHNDHNINLFFDGGWRPSFIWDEIKKQKVYLKQGSKSYFFNNRDYHGVDPEPVFRYTLRVDGTFTDELCEKLNLENGYTWKWKYKKS